MNARPSSKHTPKAVAALIQEFYAALVAVGLPEGAAISILMGSAPTLVAGMVTAADPE